MTSPCLQYCTMSKHLIGHNKILKHIHLPIQGNNKEPNNTLITLTVSTKCPAWLGLDLDVLTLPVIAGERFPVFQVSEHKVSICRAGHYDIPPVLSVGWPLFQPQKAESGSTQRQTPESISPLNHCSENWINENLLSFKWKCTLRGPLIFWN